MQEEKAPELEFGSIYTGKIVTILDRGVMIQLHPAMDPVLLPNNQLGNQRISHPSALDLAVGQDLQVKISLLCYHIIVALLCMKICSTFITNMILQVKYYGRDPASGRIRLSRKVLTVAKVGRLPHVRIRIIYCSCLVHILVCFLNGLPKKVPSVSW